MQETELDQRLARLELAVAHLTEAVEQMVAATGPDGTERSVIDSHLRDIRENFNQLPPRVAGR